MQATSKAEEVLLRAAWAKELAGEKLSSEESRALKRWETLAEARRREVAYRSVPKKDYLRMSGRQQKVVDQQAHRYGLTALLGPTIDLNALLRQIHDFLARNWMRFEKEIEEDALLSGGPGTSPATERYRGYKADLEGLKVEEKRLELLPRADVRTDMATLMSMIGTAADDLAREFGPEARVVIDEMVGRFEEHIRERYLLGEST